MAHILIIDDEKENLDALKRALGDNNPGWIILTAQSQQEGIKILEKQLSEKQPVDVVLTDLVMESEQSGMDIIREARQIDPLVMTILFTAKEKSLDRYTAFDYGAFDVVEKNIRGLMAAKEIEIKTRAALRYREWSQRINFMRRYFDPKVFDVIERDPSLLAIKRRVLTIAFWDIRGFSWLCEILKARPELIAGFLQDYFEAAARVIFAHNGVLDKFIGDGIMALFGVLNHKDDKGKTDAASAINAALNLKPEFDKLVLKWLPEWQLYVPDKIDIGLGCGIHTGEVLAGNVGTDFRDQFTAVGAPVNFAARIESRADAGLVLISSSTEIRVRDLFRTVQVDEWSDVKNIPGTFTIYNVLEK